jgi:hypothetical protein
VRAPQRFRRYNRAYRKPDDPDHHRPGTEHAIPSHPTAAIASRRFPVRPLAQENAMFDSCAVFDSSAPSAPQTDSRRRLLPPALIVLVALAAGCNPNASVYFDNTGSAPMVVSVDGQEKATIPAGEVGKVAMEPGERQIQVERGGRQLFNGVKNVEKSKALGFGRRYLFNLDDRRYVIYTVKYGTSPFAGVMERNMDAESAIRYAYQKLVKETQVMPRGSWFEIPEACYVLSDAPDVMVTRGSTAKSRVLARVDRQLYNAIEAALGREDPTEDDLVALAELVEEAMIED